MTDILLTLDYEMCNGISSGTVQNCLITPTEELLKVLDKHNFKATFFVDTCFLNRLKKETELHSELLVDYYKIINQLKRLSEDGHDLQLHLHPNWYNAIYEGGKWTSIMDDYKLSDMPSKIIDELFKDGIKLLQSISGKPVIAFRAGAYCIQTYKEFHKTFSKFGIKIDSSVNRNRKAETEKWEWFDFTDIPSKYSYRFSSDVTKYDENGSLVEISIPNYRLSYFMKYIYCFKSKLSKISTRPWGDGSSSVGGALYGGAKRFWVKLIAHCRPIYTCASIDSTGANYLNYIFEREKISGNYMLVMGHPKCLTQYSLNRFDEFLRNQKGTYNSKTISKMIDE